jgi:DNA invertase Pin-like site-specific DNA recombinase
MTQCFVYLLALPTRLDPVPLDERRAEAEAYRNHRLPGVPLAGVWTDGTDAWRLPFLRRRAAAELVLKVQSGDHVVIPTARFIAANNGAWIRPLAALHAKGVHVHLVDVGLCSSTEEGRSALEMVSRIASAGWPSRRKNASQTTTS